MLLWQGRWDAAREAAAESARIAEATRSLWQLSIARAIDCFAHWMLERKPEAVESIVSATDWLLPRDNGLFRSLNHGWLAEGLQALGRHDEARQHAVSAFQRARLRRPHRRGDGLSRDGASRRRRKAGATRPGANWRGPTASRAGATRPTSSR